MNIRLILAVWACKLGILGSRLLGKKGTSMPGHLAMRICPNILTLLSGQVKEDIIVVCGTNGKTTTNNLLSAFVSSAGKKVVCNTVGANMIWGVCCAFAEKANLLGRLDADFACLEVDEASSVHVLRYVKPTYMIVTNLFRDQLDRYGTVEQTLDYIRRSLELSPETKLILNADDPMVARLGENTHRKCYYFGIDEEAGTEEEKESSYCTCGEKLEYDLHHYSHLGKYRCPKCGFGRHELDFSVRNIDLSEGIRFSLFEGDKTTDFVVNYRGLYNIYNIALSFSTAHLVLGTVSDHETVLAAYHPQIGRMEEFYLGKPVVLNMAKNPAGFNQSISAVLTDKREKDLLIGVNDNPSDGVDVSWLWDVNFERLKDANVRRLVVTGIRADELMLRMKHAGFPEEKQIKTQDLKLAADSLLSGDAPVCYALANYTVVFPLQEIFKERDEKHGA